jgi:hypothetical protein
VHKCRHPLDDEPIAQGATGPVVASAAHRQREITRACGSNGRLDVFRRVAVDGRARPVRPGRCCSGRWSVRSIKSVIVCRSFSKGHQ